MKREDSQLTKRSLKKVKDALRRVTEDTPIHKFVTDPVTFTHSTQLINQVENIDLNDGINPQLVSEYVNDIYEYLLHLENEFRIHKNFMEKQVEITPKMRQILIGKTSKFISNI